MAKAKANAEVFEVMPVITAAVTSRPDKESKFDAEITGLTENSVTLRYKPIGKKYPVTEIVPLEDLVSFGGQLTVGATGAFSIIRRDAPTQRRPFVGPIETSNDGRFVTVSTDNGDVTVAIKYASIMSAAVKAPSAKGKATKAKAPAKRKKAA